MRRKGDMLYQENFFLSRHFVYCLIEIIFTLICPSIFFLNKQISYRNIDNQIQMAYSFNDIIIILWQFKFIYYIFEVFKCSKYSCVRIHRVNLLLTSKSLNVISPIKNYISNHPFGFMFLSFIISMFFFTHVTLILERNPLKNEESVLEGWPDGLWYIMVTMLTIGYGDIVVQTFFARIIIIFLVIWGNLWSSIFLSAIYPYLQLTTREEKAYNQINRMILKEKIENYASKVITKMLQLNMLKKIDEKNYKKVQRYNKELFFLLEKLRVTKKNFNEILKENDRLLDNIIMNFQTVTATTEEMLLNEQKFCRLAKTNLESLKK